MFVGRGALHKSPEIKVMYGRIPGDYPQTVADFHGDEDTLTSTRN